MENLNKSYSDIIYNFNMTKGASILDLKKAMDMFNEHVLKEGFKEKVYSCIGNKCKDNIEFGCIEGSFCPTCGVVLPF